MKARFLFTKQIRSGENARDPLESEIYHLSPSSVPGSSESRQGCSGYLDSSVFLSMKKRN